MTKFREWPQEIFIEADAIVGGPPCQAFSVAGLRAGLSDDRGNLTLTYAELINHADAIRTRAGKQPVVVLYENVPGLLSDKTGAFGSLLGALAGEDGELQPPGKKWTNAGCVSGPERALAWAVTDAQFFGVAQRRRRVFLIGSARDGFNPAAILFEPDRLRRDIAPSREARQVAPTIPSRSTASGGLGTDFDCDGGLIAKTLCAGGHSNNPLDETLVTAHTLRGEGFDASEDGTGRGTPLVPVAFDTTQVTSKTNRSNPKPGDPCHPLAAGAHAPAIAFPANLSGTQYASTENLSPALGAANPTAVAFSSKDYGADATNDLAPTLRAMNHTESHANGGGGQMAVAYTTKLHNTGSNNAGKIFEERTTCLDANSPPPALLTAMQVRRLTPVECEKLQGFPPGYTMIPWRKKPAEDCPDGPRYRALGNSWAVPNVAWIGRRIQAHLDGLL